MSMKGVPHARDYTISRIPRSPKTKRLEDERKARERNKARLSEAEKILYRGLRWFGQDLLEATGRGLIVDESQYAKAIGKVLKQHKV